MDNIFNDKQVDTFFKKLYEICSRKYEVEIEIKEKKENEKKKN